MSSTPLTRDSELELLAAGARDIGIDLNAARAATLLKLVDELELGNAQFNLTAIRDRLGMLRKHVLDSLSLQPYLRGMRIADIGTGAGFPGLPLAIVNPQRRFTLIEATGKKARFAEQTALHLGCDNVRVEHVRAESYRPFELFDTVVARALASLERFRRLCGPFVRSGWALAGDEGKTAGRGDFRPSQIVSRPGGAPPQGARAGRRAASCGTLTGPAQIEQTMKRVIAVANQKGGVGKTTTAVNLAASLTATKRRVLLIDLDPQGNATMGCGVDKHAQSRTSCDVMLGDCAAMEALVPVEYGGFMLMPSNQDLTAAEVRLLGMMTGREFKLRNALKPVREDFDVILIDCPPSLNMLTLNALVAADSVMVPMQCEYYALEGLSSLVQTIEQIRASINPDLEIEGLLRTMFDPRNNLANEVSAQLIEHFGEKVFRTMIPRNVRLAEAPSFGKPALFHDKESRGAWHISRSPAR